jgi:putative ABC transport system permease protein
VVKVRALERKLLRDVVRLAAPAIAAALVVAAGIMAFIAMRGAYVSLELARAGYFERGRFADVYAPVVRAPVSVLERARAIPGVEEVDHRVTADGLIDLPEAVEPARARFVSTRGDVGLNRLSVRAGRLPGRDRVDEVVVNEAFAEARALALGDRLVATVEGRLTALRIVGIGGSPDFLYVVPPGSAFPDDERYAVLWLDHGALEAILDMRGAATEIFVRLGAGADEGLVLDELDRLLARYGGIGAVGRDDQLAWRFIDEELSQLDAQTWAIPLLFLGVAALLLHMVLTRLVESQREIIALLKAVGYANRRIALHYAELALLIVSSGALLGVLSGALLGEAMMGLYQRFFRFDVLAFQLAPSHVASAITMSVAAGLLGAQLAVRRAVALEPAAAMQPPVPPRYTAGWAERVPGFRRSSASTRMILRQLLRRPVRALLTTLGIALAGAIVVVSSVFTDAMSYAAELYFLEERREDVEVAFVAPTPAAAAVAELAHIEGVLLVEPTRAVPVRLRRDEREWEGAIEALHPASELRRGLDERGRRLPRVPPHGLVLTRELARRLEAPVGSEVIVERLDDDRRVTSARVAGLSDDLLGLHATASLAYARELFRDGDLATGALLLVDPAREAEVSRALRERPAVAGVAFRERSYESFRRLMTESTAVTSLILGVLASIIAVGIVYNSSRIALAERARELATLRVLGMTRAEVSTMFLGEQVALLAVAVPTSWGIGRIFAGWLMASVSASDLFHLPLVTDASTYAFATAVVLGAATLTALLMRRRIDHLDLVAVLKARE